MGPRNSLLQSFVIVVIILFYGASSFDFHRRHILNLITYLNNTKRGLQFIPGVDNKTQALVLSGQNRDLALPDIVTAEALENMKETNDMTIMATVKQTPGNSGSIVSFSTGVMRYLEVESSGRKDEIRFHYTHNYQIRVETFPYRLADDQWHKLAFGISGTQLTLYVDCVKIYSRVIQTIDREPRSEKDVKLYVGQRNAHLAFYKGALQDVRIITQADGHLVQCPNSDTVCPTCSQFQAMEQQVRNIYSMYHNLSIELQRAKQRIAELEQCECRRSCQNNGTLKKEDEVWHPNPCTTCVCKNGSSVCRQLDCPPVGCEKPVYMDGECCPVCISNCFFSGKYYEHGATVSPKVCVTCECKNGLMDCISMNPERDCPKLDCPKEDYIHIYGQCCPICSGTDFCGQGHNCHANATCHNLSTRYACQCKMGFKGDGQHCEDVDECLTRGDPHGHHCTGLTKCHNTMGSYECLCSGGFVPEDPYNCDEETDVCVTGEHGCHKFADCQSSKGSYKCSCKYGYTGNGYDCQPICPGGCLHGNCVYPNVCECRHGYIGTNCELDIDECVIGISKCAINSVCINTPGWYTCDCIEGYHSRWPDNNYGSLCFDLNECEGEGGGHSCHESTECVNTEGGYKCVCNLDTPCVGDCMKYGEYHRNNTKWLDEEEKCIQCSCLNGVTTCHKKSCDCSDPDVDLECCRHCDEKSKCQHQLVPTYLSHGQKWMFQCQTCECLDGEIDCWPLTCPTLACPVTVQEPTDCCPRCVDDNPCLSLTHDVGGTDNSAQTCLYEGHRYTHGDQWFLREDSCTACECKVGHICCLFNHTCTSLPDQYHDKVTYDPYYIP